MILCPYFPPDQCHSFSPRNKRNEFNLLSQGKLQKLRKNTCTRLQYKYAGELAIPNRL